MPTLTVHHTHPYQLNYIMILDIKCRNDTNFICVPVRYLFATRYWQIQYLSDKYKQDEEQKEFF